MGASSQAKAASGLRAQVRLAWRLAALASVIGFGAAILAVTLEKTGPSLASDLLAWAAMGLISIGFLTGFGLGFFRPMMARGWHAVPEGRLRDFVLRSAALRWWYWLDQNGGSRDVG